MFKDQDRHTESLGTKIDFLKVHDQKNQNSI